MNAIFPYGTTTPLLDDYAPRLGSAGADALQGLAGADQVIAGLGADTVLGGGGITEELLRLLAPFEVEATVVRRDPRPVPGAVRTLGADRIDDALDGADGVVLALALTPETTGIIDAAALDRMPDHACLVNVARGGHVVTDDLVAAFAAGTLGSAGLDLHDLAQRAAAPTLADVMSTSAWPRPAPPTTPPSTASTEPVRPPGSSDREWERALRRARGEVPPKREPAPLPVRTTSGHLSWPLDMYRLLGNSLAM